MRTLLFLLFCLFLACGLTACGKRPGAVDAPDGTDPKVYPRTYPDIKTDPKPRS